MRAPIVVMMALLAAGCVGRKSDPPTEAAIPPTSAWRNADQTSVTIAARWWESFNDAALSRTVATALTQNDDIAVAVTRVAQARAQFRLARAETLPSVAFAAQGGRDRDVNPGFGVPELQTAGEGELQASYDLDLFGRLSSATRAARASLLATRAVRDSVRLAVAASAVSGYITLRSLDARLDVLRETLAARADELKIAQRRAQIGYSSKLDLTQAQSEYDATEALIPATELAITREENGLSVLLGTSPHAIERGAPFETLSNPTIPPLVPAEVLRRRPDIAAAEQTLAATDHSLDSARAAFMPNVQLSGAGGYVGSTLVDASPIGVFALGASILEPLFDGGRRRGQVDLATARRDEAAFNYRKAVLTAFREVEDALASVHRQSEVEQSLARQRDVLADTLRLATSRYRSGYATYLDQLDAQRGLLSVRLSLVATHADRLTAAVALYQALGGGWHTQGQADEASDMGGPS